MPSPDSLKIKLFTPIPSVPEVDLNGKMLTKDATTKDCLFTMTEYLSENVLQGIPKEFRIKQFFDKGLFKSFRKQNPFNKTENPEPAKEKETPENPEPAKEKESLENPEQVETIVNNRELISTYRNIINHNIRLTLNTLFQKNNKIVIKGNTYTIGYYNWTDYDWDIDAKRPTFDKQQYITSQSVNKSLEKIPSILKHGLVTTNDNKLTKANDFFSVTAFDNEEEAVKAKESLRQGQTKGDAIELDHEDDEKSRLELIKVEKARKTLGLKPPVAIKQERIAVPKISPSEEDNTVPETELNQPNITPLESNTVNEGTITQEGGETNENKSGSQMDSFNDSHRSSDPTHRSSDPTHRSSSFDRRFPYDPRYDPRYRSHSKMVNIDESNFAIYISVELYLVKGETLTPEDESNLNCKNNWNKVLVPFDKLIGREKRGILPDYTLEPTSKPESPKTNGSQPTSKEPEPPTSKEPEPPTSKELTAHGGRRPRKKTLRQKKRKTAKKNKHNKRKVFKTTRKRKLGSSKRK